ncbi:hypothetical protein PoMZ_06949, partial [Pyricularia oryzae]
QSQVPPRVPQRGKSRGVVAVGVTSANKSDENVGAPDFYCCLLAVCLGDLTKPKCHRCVTGGVECTYPTGVTFAPNKTISQAQHVQSPSLISPSYSRLQFLEPGSRRRARPKSHKLNSSKFTLPRTASPVAAEHETPKTDLSSPGPFQQSPSIPCTDVSSPTSAHWHGLGILAVVPGTDEVPPSSYVMPRMPQTTRPRLRCSCLLVVPATSALKKYHE